MDTLKTGSLCEEHFVCPVHGALSVHSVWLDFLNRHTSSVYYVPGIALHTPYTVSPQQSPQQPNGVHVSLQMRKLKAQEDKYFPKIPEPGRVELGGNPDLPASKTPALESL